MILNFGPYSDTAIAELPSWYIEWLIHMYPTELSSALYDSLQLEYDWRTVNASHWDDGKANV